jgi:plasmid stabilization system protein ParE
MNAAVEITPRAIEDIDRIWSFIAADSPQAADRVHRRRLSSARGTSPDRLEATGYYASPGAFLDRDKIPELRYRLSARFGPRQIVAVLHGRRDLKEVLEGGV